MREKWKASDAASKVHEFQKAAMKFQEKRPTML
jgi:hypothetical protein